MKKHIIAIAAIAAFFVPDAQAQDNDIDEPELRVEKPKPATRKGNLTIGSNIGLASLAYGRSVNSNNHVYNYDVRLNPSVGYFLSDHWLVSGTLSAGIAAQRNESIYNSRNITAGIGLGARYYFGKAVDSKGDIKKLRFYAEAGGMFTQTWARTRISGNRYNDFDYNDVSLQAGAGINYFVAPNVAFEAGLSYYRALEMNQPNPTRSNLGLNLGLRFFLNRK